MIEKTFDPAAIEAKCYAHWEASGAFRPPRPDAEPYTIVIPPPNVTGSLHIGHALDNTLQDILIRYERLRGKDALWVVGTDHAGIATQMVVERLLDAEGVKRTEMGREAFLERVWRWKEESGGAITRQLRRLGASCDWANERFTMDAGFSAAVRKVFVQLYNEGLIYRAKRLVNWDPKLKTAISDLEVETREVTGGFWHVRYPLADGARLDDGRDHLVVATTRPETMLADMAVAVNAADARYESVIGKFVKLPITGRRVPIIADDHADPALGSGAVKITPGHDFNDFEVGRRAGILASDMLNMFDAQARVAFLPDVPPKYLRVDRSDARKLVVADLEAAGLLKAVEEKTIQMPYGDRSGVVIEPWLTDQWYVDAAKLAEAPMVAVRAGETRFVPETWSKTFFQWMENIQPWCVSRQLWWGHRIPAWYGPSYTGVLPTDYTLPRHWVAESEREVLRDFDQYYRGEQLTIHGSFAEADSAVKSFRPGIHLWRDPDVLDTWFSSALWPFATLGWPEQGIAHPEHEQGLLRKHYPNSVLITGFDIIFFWVARMQMMGHHVMGEVPFHTVYCHGLVRDGKGQKMSKSKGNAVDPLGLIDKYGADALRFFMAAMETQGRDIKMSEPRVEGYRNFATKLWNAARFAQSNGIGGSTHLEPPRAHVTVNQWIIAETVGAIQAVELSLGEYRFDAAAGAIYRFVWSRFCDWYLELTKPILAEPGAAADETRAVAGWVLDQILVVLHPFMPFITEELWHALMPGRSHDLILARWPMADARALNSSAAREIDWLIRLIGEIRSARSEVNVPPGSRTDLLVMTTIFGAVDASHPPPTPTDLIDAIRRNRLAIYRMARVDDVLFGNTGVSINLLSGHLNNRLEEQAYPRRYLGPQVIVDDVTYILPVEGVIDLAAERARLERARATAVKEATALTGRLANAGFLAKAKPEAVDEAREKLTTLEAEAARLAAALARLG